MMPMLTSSVLFVRCVPVPDALKALRGLRAACPGARVDVLTSPASAAQIEHSGLADAVIPYEGRRFSLLQTGTRLIVAMRRMRYDTVIVPITALGQDAFWNVARIALLFGGGRTVWQPTDRTPAAEVSEWPIVSVRPRWFPEREKCARWRAAAARPLVVGGLVFTWLAAMAALAIAALVLIPLVWLTPGGRR
jgi:hypothetical protein